MLTCEGGNYALHLFHLLPDKDLEQRENSSLSNWKRSMKGEVIKQCQRPRGFLHARVSIGFAHAAAIALIGAIVLVIHRRREQASNVMENSVDSALKLRSANDFSITFDACSLFR
jgi:hypothetical protein